MCASGGDESDDEWAILAGWGVESADANDPLNKQPPCFDEQELMYLLCIKRLKDESLTIVTDLGDAAPAGNFKGNKPAAEGDAIDLNNSNNAMGRRMEQVGGLFVGGTNAACASFGLPSSMWTNQAPPPVGRFVHNPNRTTHANTQHS